MVIAGELDAGADYGHARVWELTRRGSEKSRGARLRSREATCLLRAYIADPVRDADCLAVHTVR